MASNKLTYQELEKKIRELEIENRRLKNEIPILNHNYSSAKENNLIGTKEKRENSEEKYKTLVENTPDIITRFDRNLRHIFVNSTYQSITGRLIKDLLGKTHRDIGNMDMDNINYSEKIIKQIFETKTSIEFETQIKDKAGNTIYLFSKGVPEFDESGNVKSALFIHRDISDRKKVEIELIQAKEKAEESENRLSIIYNNTTDMLCLLKVEQNNSMRYVSVNKTYLDAGRSQKLDLNENDFINETVDYVLKNILNFDDKTIETELDHLKGVAKSKTAKNFVRTIVTPVGPVYLETNLVPIMNHKNICTHILWSSRDITILKQAENDSVKAKEKAEESERELQFKNEEYESINEELRQTNEELYEAKEKAEESEQKYKALYNNAPLSYQSLDEKGCFIDINPTWLKILGYERHEVIGKWFGSFLHPDYVDHFNKNFPAFKKRGYVSDVQFKLKRKDHNFIYVSFEGCADYTPEGDFKQTYCVFKDITEQKAIENNLLKTKDFLDNLVNTANTIIVGLDIEGKVFLYNQTAELITGYTKQEIQNKNWFETLVPKNKYPEVWSEFVRITEKGIPKNFENPILTKNGEERYILWQNNVIEENGIVTGTISFGMDITENKN